MSSPFLTGFRSTPAALVSLIQSITDPPCAATIDALATIGYFDPTEAEIDDWLRPCAGWKAWGPACLVCHSDVPDGQAVAYPFIFGSRACIGDCAAHVDSLLRVYDRSRRGRWRTARQVHDLANGAACGVPHGVTA